MQSAFAELEAGDEDVAEDETLSEADFERELHAMRREEDELRAALEAAKQTLTLTPTLTLTLTLNPSPDPNPSPSPSPNPSPNPNPSSH